MLRLRDGQADLFDALMPAEARVLSPELSAVDVLLDDDRFLAPFVARFACPIGRPTIPIETYLRLTYLNHRHGLGCETTALQVEGWCRGSHQSSQTPLRPESDTSRGLHRRPDLGRQSGADAIPATHDLAYSASGFFRGK